MKKAIFPNKIYQFLLTILGSVVLVTPLMFLKEKYSFIGENLFMNLFFMLQMGVACIFLFLMNRKRKVAPFYVFALKDKQLLFKSMTLIIIFCLGVIPIANNYLQQLINHRPLSYEYPGWVLIGGAVILGPVFEELLFRQFFLSGLLGKYKLKWAILINIVIFALIHIKPIQIWPALLYGLLFSIVFYKTRSVANTILLHALTNGTTLFFVFLQLKFTTFSHFYAAYSTLILIISTILILILIKSWFLSSLMSRTRVPVKASL